MTKKLIDSEDNNSFYIEPDLEELAKDVSFCPFKKLFGAILERAFLDLRGPLELREDALEWFSAEKVEDPEIMSFQLICEVLGFDFLQIQIQILTKSSTELYISRE